MSFIDDRLAERKELERRNNLIDEHAIPIYEALWKKIAEHVKEAHEKGLPVLTNGSLQNRIVRMSVDPAPHQSGRRPDEFRLVLKNDRISARGDRGLNLEFTLDVCPDGLVCLKAQGMEISVEEAAIRILDPFLFPDLPRLSRPE